MGSADGKTFISMSGGSMSGLLIEAAGLDITEAWCSISATMRACRSAAPPGHRSRQGRGQVRPHHHGYDRFRPLHPRRINLRKEFLKMDIFADAKDFSVLDLDAPVHLEGKIRAPEISIGKGVPIR
jgi:hypothetical protein